RPLRRYRYRRRDAWTRTRLYLPLGRRPALGRPRLPGRRGVNLRTVRSPLTENARFRAGARAELSCNSVTFSIISTPREEYAHDYVGPRYFGTQGQARHLVRFARNLGFRRHEDDGRERHRRAAGDEWPRAGGNH